MGFFETPPPFQPPEEFPQPEWIGPPEGVLGGVVPVQVIVARTANVLIAATHFAVYPNGLTFEIRGLVHEPAPRGRRSGMLWDDGDPHTALRIGILFADGRRVTNLSQDWPTGDDEPAGPTLICQGGGGGERSFDQGYWVWPAPPPGPLVVVAEWPAEAVPESRATIEAGLLDDARSRIEEVWPDSRPASGGWTSRLTSSGARPRPSEPAPPGAGPSE